MVPKVKPVKLTRNILLMPNNRVNKMLKIKCVNIQFVLLAIGILLISTGAFHVSESTSEKPYLVSYAGGGITEMQFDLARQTVESNKPQDKSLLLDFLVTEALLIERAKDLGVIESDASVRKALSRSMIDRASSLLSGTALTVEPPAAELKAFYQHNPVLFQSPEKTHIKIYLLKANSNNQGVAQALQFGEALRDRLLKQENIAEHLSPYMSALPSGFVSVAALPKYIGPSLAAKAASLREGDISRPILIGKHLYLIVCHGFIASRTLAFEGVKDDVVLELQRRKRDEALRLLLDKLWEGADIKVATRLGFSVKEIQLGERTDG